MNPDQLAALWATLWPIITAVVAVASTLDASLPQPAAGSHWLLVRKVVSFLAVNVGNASNGGQPSFVTWIIRIATPVLQAQGQMPAAVAPPAPAPTPSATTVVGALLAGLLLTGGLSACNADGTLTTKTQNVLTSMAEVACVADGILQPIALVVGPSIAAANGIDAKTVSLVVQVDGPLHQSIQNGCSALKGTATATPVTP